MAESKGKMYEEYIKSFFEKWGNSLSIVLSKGELEWVEKQYKIVGASGMKWSFDIAFLVRDENGQEYKFIIEAKNYRTSKLTPGEVSELAGKISEINDIAGVILISSNDLSKNSELVASHHNFECWKMPFNEGDTSYLIINKELKLIQAFDEESYNTLNRVEEEYETIITYADGRIERLNL
ncbi:hypothetical protein CXK86_19630 [Paenibacillus sp. BGI2013]|uniref:restriction endonuclease n=1 Tax=Paenibacillus sp. BGI2013 TaxID=2058902 RepID=UPI000C6DEC71|nr:restriction endonuclease [Paenibacillus sp. BGI2013]PKQ89265.1 hypothetical protein CXK86_19630 [Paenibacillus sp. BGI2013]